MFVLGNVSRIDVDRLLKIGRAAMALWGSGIAVVSLLYIFVLGSSCENESAETSLISSTQAEKELRIAGALSLKAQGSSQLLAMAQDLVVLGRNLRPDAKGILSSVLFGLKTSASTLQTHFGESFFLTCNEQEGKEPSFQFSKEPTSLCVKPLKMTKSEVIVEVVKQGEKGEEKERVALKAKAESSAANLPCFCALKGAKWWGRDVLIQKYGGETGRSLGQKEKLECAGEVLFVMAGDYLTWKEGQWKIASLNGIYRNNLKNREFGKEAPQNFDAERATIAEGQGASEHQNSEAKPTEPKPDSSGCFGISGAPLAHIKGVGNKTMDIEMWDETGFQYLEIKLPLETPPRLQCQMEQMPSSIRMRTSSQVSCLIGKRRVIVREGDWLLKTATGWRNLKTREEIDAVLEHRLRGQLLVFDHLEREGGSILKGYLFDEMRTQQLPFSLPIAEKKTRKKLSVKEKKK